MCVLACASVYTNMLTRISIICTHVCTLVD